jgi:endoglucanase
MAYAVIALAGCSNTPVSRHGQLTLKDKVLVDKRGEKVQLRGFSSENLSKSEMYLVLPNLKELRDDFSSDVIRTAMYIHRRDFGYSINPGLKDIVKRIVRDATKTGLYVVIDWHIMAEKNPMITLEDSKLFFAEMSKEFGKQNNIIYEICNEPNGDEVTWDGEIRPYAEEIIKVIRANDKRNIILVGTPNFSSRPDLAMDSPLPDPLVMYVFHFYAGINDERSRDTIRRAMTTLPVFCSEFGSTGPSGSGKLYPEELSRWMNFMEENSISWCNWNLSTMSETSAALQLSYKLGSGVKMKDKLSKSGELIYYFMNRNRKSADILKIPEALAGVPEVQ